jgi:TonB family protein
LPLRRRSNCIAGVTLLLAALAAWAGEIRAQSPGRYTAITLSDSVRAFIQLRTGDTSGDGTSITVYTPEGVFRLRGDSSALASWARASAALAGPTPQSGPGSNGKMTFSATILRASDESGNAMRLLRVSGDSLSAYSLAVSNGAWEFVGRVPPEKVGPLFHALSGTEGDGLTWKPVITAAEPPNPAYRPAEAAPNNPRPRYPARAELGRAAGTVVVQFIVDPNGRARRQSLLIIRSTHPLFSLAVRDALAEMRFLPATLSGVPVESIVMQTFEFRLP